MADIELVIKVPEDLYEAYKGRQPMLGDVGMDMIAQAISNGTPLPKDHGRLIDERTISRVYMNKTEQEVVNDVKIYPSIEIVSTDAPTIIEADRAESKG